MKHGVPQDGHTGQGAQKATARLTLRSDEDSPQEKGMGRESIPERGTAPAKAGDRAQHRGWGCKQPEAETSPWGRLAPALGEWEVTAAGVQSERASAAAAVGPVPRGRGAQPSHTPDGPRYRVPENPASGSRSARIHSHHPRSTQVADPECAQHGADENGKFCL